LLLLEHESAVGLRSPGYPTIGYRPVVSDEVLAPKLIDVIVPVHVTVSYLIIPDLASFYVSFKGTDATAKYLKSLWSPHVLPFLVIYPAGRGSVDSWWHFRDTL
jgi:hypothetical protein